MRMRHSLMALPTMGQPDPSSSDTTNSTTAIIAFHGYSPKGSKCTLLSATPYLQRTIPWPSPPLRAHPIPHSLCARPYRISPQSSWLVILSRPVQTSTKKGKALQPGGEAGLGRQEPDCRSWTCLMPFPLSPPPPRVPSHSHLA